MFDSRFWYHKQLVGTNSDSDIFLVHVCIVLIVLMKMNWYMIYGCCWHIIKDEHCGL